MDVGSWLRSLGLERYEAAFRDNEITEKVLPRLTAEDLKDLGVSVVGHRRVCCSTQLLICVVTQACTLQQSLQHPRGHRQPRQLPRPSQKRLASADVSR